MNANPTPLQTLILWRLLSTGGAAFLQEIKPELRPEDKKSLHAAGLIEVEQRKPGHPKARRQTFISLSEAGWAWAEEHLDAPISHRTPAAGPILQVLLTKVKWLMRRHQLSLSELISSGSTQPASNESTVEPRREPISLTQRVRESYSRLSGGRTNVRVRLKDLRSDLSDVPAAALDDVLLQMERNHAVSLYPLDHPLEVTDDDIKAALPNTVGGPRHVVYMETQHA